jgi:hypothetical protein
MYKLYGRPGSGSFAVQVALEEIGAPFERIWVGREAADIARFRTINPTGRVPALVLPDGTAMFESAAMLIHLALTHPQSALAPPPGTSRHAAFLQWMVFLSANAYEAVLRARTVCAGRRLFHCRPLFVHARVVVPRGEARVVCSPAQVGGARETRVGSPGGRQSRG